MKMTSAQALIVLEVVEGATADEIKQAYKKRVLKWYTFLVNIKDPTQSETNTVTSRSKITSSCLVKTTTSLLSR